MKSFPLPNGNMPAIGLGTWKMDDGAARPAVQLAMELGYRHIDCAHIYLNEPEIGEVFGAAFRRGNRNRDDYWITSKIWCNRHRPELVEEALKATLFDLQLDYLDLYMIHWPLTFRQQLQRPDSRDGFLTWEEVPLQATWQAMEQCVAKGLCKNLGVCNFSIANLQKIIDSSTFAPAVNQVECHPFLPQTVLFQFCHCHQILPVAYSPLGSGDRPERMRGDADPNLFENEILLDMAAANSISVGQLLLAWAVNRGTVAIPKSTNQQRLTDNLAAGEIELSDSDMQAIGGIDSKHRFVHGKFWESLGSPYSTADIWGQEGR